MIAYTLQIEKSIKSTYMAFITIHWALFVFKKERATTLLLTLSWNLNQFKNPIYI